jgi:hypothetical protein
MKSLHALTLFIFLILFTGSTYGAKKANNLHSTLRCENEISFGKYYASKHMAMYLYRNGTFKIQGKTPISRGSSKKRKKYKFSGQWYCFQDDSRIKIVIKDENEIIDTLSYFPEKKTIISTINPISMEYKLCWIKK